MNLSEKLAAAEDEVEEGVPAKLSPRPRLTRAELLARKGRSVGQSSRDDAWSIPSARSNRWC